MSEHAPDLILRPTGKRRATLRYGGTSHPVVAQVTMSDHGRGHYGSVLVRVGPSAQSESDPWAMATYPHDIRVVYQIHTKPECYLSYLFRPARGFMSPNDGPWSEAYGEEFVCSDLDAMGRMIPLLRRAQDAARKRFIMPAKETRPDGTVREYTRFKGARGDALRLIVGLRLIGVEVRIYSARIRELHERRSRARTAEREVERNHQSYVDAAYGQRQAIPVIR